MPRSKLCHLVCDNLMLEFFQVSFSCMNVLEKSIRENHENVLISSNKVSVICSEMKRG